MGQLFLIKKKRERRCATAHAARLPLKAASAARNSNQARIAGVACDAPQFSKR
jgi:hypothetical protein